MSTLSQTENVAGDVKLPELNEENLAKIEQEKLDVKNKETKEKKAAEDKWVIETANALQECVYYLKKTSSAINDGFREAAEQKISALKKESEKLGIPWFRVEYSCFIARIQKCPIPDVDKPATTSASVDEMSEIVKHLTAHPHHRNERDGDPEVPLYHWADKKEVIDIKQHQKKHGHPPIGCRFFKGRWLYPNNDPLTGGKTRYQKKVEISFGELLGKYVVGINKVNYAEVERINKNATEELSGILIKQPCEKYFVKKPNGRGALLVRGFFKKFHSKNEGKEESTDVFVIAIVKAVGECRYLSGLKGHYIPVQCAIKGFIPRNTPKELESKVRKFTQIMSKALESVKK